MIFNGSDKNAVVKIPKGTWRVIARDGRLNADGLTDADGKPMEIKGGKVTVEPTSALILFRK